jgi:hypothetical protein
MGKTYVSAASVCWWISTRTPGKARAFSTAPTAHQVKALLWGEMGNLWPRLNTPGRCLTTELKLPTPDGPDYLAAWGRKPADHQQSNFQGVHAEEGVLVVVDEACGVPGTMLEDLEKNLTGEWDRQLLIFNPDDPTSYAARIVKGELPGWHVITLDGYDSPNWTGEDVPDAVKGALLSKRWAQDQADKYGVESDTYRKRVRGIFPKDSSAGVISATHLARVRDPNETLTGTVRILGIDVGAGGDWTVCTLRIGDGVHPEVWRIRTPDPGASIDELLDIIDVARPDIVRVDGIGIGWGIAGALDRERGRHHAKVERIVVSEASSDPARFLNLRSELWWKARERCEQRTWDLSGASPDALEQLGWPHWSEGVKGKIVVEPKAETIKRQGHSPDDADSLLLCWADGRTGPVGVAAPPKRAGAPTLSWFGSKR